MKVPEKTTENKENNERPQEKTSDLVAYRKKRKQRANTIKLAVIGGILILVVVIAANFNSIIEPFRGIASQINNKTSSDVGFPVQLPGSATYSFSRFGNDFLLLTDTYLYTFNTSGGQNYAFRHGCTNSVQTANDKRILLYDKGYYEFSLFSHTSRIYENTTEEKIVYGTLSSNDMAAIVTTSSRFSNELYVYDGGGDWKYKRKFTDENVMNVVFSGDERYIYVTTIGVENGEIYSAIYRFDINSSEDEIWRYQVNSSSIPCEIYCANSIVTVAYDNMTVAVTESTGELINAVTFSGELLAVDFSGSATAVLYAESATNKTVLAMLDSQNNLMGKKTVNVLANRVVLDGDSAYLLESDGICIYNRNAELQKTVETVEEYSSFIKIDNYVYLLGYDCVQQQSLN